MATTDGGATTTRERRGPRGRSTRSAPNRPRMAGGPVDPRLLRYATASRRFFLVSAAIVLAQTGVIIGFAWLLTRALVGAIAGEPVQGLLPLLAGALVLVVIRALLIAASERVSLQGAARASLQLRAALVAAVQKLGPGWMSGRNAASLAVTAGHGLETLDAYFGRYLPQLVATVITMPILVVAIAVSDPISGLIVIVTMPLIPLFMVLIGLATRAVQRRQLGTLQRLAARFADTVSGLGTLKIFGRERRAADSIETVTRDYKRETMTVLRVSFLSGFALEFLASISVAIIAVTIGFRLLSGDMVLLTGLFVLLLAPEAYLPLRQVGVQFHAAAEGVAATDSLFEVLDAADAVVAAPTAVSSAVRALRTARDADGPRDPGETVPLLETRALRVHRGDRSLPPVDLMVRAGEVLLLEGPSGSGKSSVLAALLGFADHDGAVLVEGVADASARSILAWSGQQPGLISGTVRENVTLGAANADAALATQCLTDAQAGDIDPMLELGVRGAGLSGGQAQRVSVARALYRLRDGRARVLALDEPTSALDAATEAALWHTLRAEADAGAGVLLVSHRASARGIADRIVRLEASDAPTTFAPDAEARA